MYSVCWIYLISKIYELHFYMIVLLHKILSLVKFYMKKQ